VALLSGSFPLSSALQSSVLEGRDEQGVVLEPQAAATAEALEPPEEQPDVVRPQVEQPPEEVLSNPCGRV
jgi:hypothetical protein